MAVEGRRIRTAFVFVRELFRLRALADANDQDPRLNYGATTGAMLETVERYAYTEEVIGYIGDQDLTPEMMEPHLEQLAQKARVLLVEQVHH